MGNNLIRVGGIDKINIEWHKPPQQRRGKGKGSAAKANF
jgi:hypothetical protein